MKKLLLLSLLLMAVGISKNCIAATFAVTFKFSVDTVRKKLVRPKEAMNDDAVTAILTKMRGKRNDAEKVQCLKDEVKDKGIKVNQLIILLNQFLADESKMECAQYAFPYITNYKGFLDIMDLFAQEGNKHRLEDFYDKARKW
jgi:hypothetical protein